MKSINLVYPVLQQTLIQYQDQLQPIKEKQEELLQQINELEREVKNKMISKSTFKQLLCLSQLNLFASLIITILIKN